MGVEYGYWQVTNHRNNEKIVAAQPTGWEVGGGPPGAAISEITGCY